MGDGTPSSSQAGCQHGLILEDMIPSAEHHTFVIILTADCLTWIMNESEIQAEVVASSSPLLGQSRATSPQLKQFLL